MLWSSRSTPWMASLLVAACCFVVGASPVQAATKGAPFAVMPFMDLAQDRSLSWLSDGVAETLATDLKRSGFVVVERSAIDAALAELALVAASKIEPSTASKLGRMVGAKTVVVGSFQVSGQSVRLVARFVEVETGLVKGSAKATGTRKKIFAIQDEIAMKLTGKKPPRKSRNKRRKKRRATGEALASASKGGAQTREAQADPRGPSSTQTNDMWAAFRLYSRSIRVTGAAKKALLEASLEFDPGFRYSLDALEAIEARFEAARMDANKLALIGADKLMAMARDENNDAAVRAASAQMAISKMLTARHVSRAIEAAKEVYKMKLPPDGPIDVNAFALQQLVAGYRQLGEYDESIRLAEEFVTRFPQSPMLPSVESNLHSSIRTLRKRAEMREKRPKEEAKLAKRFADYEKRVARQKERGKLRVEQNERVLHNLLSRRCTLKTQYFDDDNAVSVCRAYVEEYKDVEGAQPGVYRARQALMLYYRNTCAFDKMRELSNEIQTNHPEHARAAREAIQYIPQ